jgi:hypothetical protein
MKAYPEDFVVSAAEMPHADPKNTPNGQIVLYRGVGPERASRYREEESVPPEIALHIVPKVKPRHHSARDTRISQQKVPGRVCNDRRTRALLGTCAEGPLGVASRLARRRVRSRHGAPDSRHSSITGKKWTSIKKADRPQWIARIVQRRAAIQNSWRCPVQQNFWTDPSVARGVNVRPHHR